MPVHDGIPDEDVVKNKRVGQLEAIAKQERRMEEQGIGLCREE